MKRTLTLVLSDGEMSALEALAKQRSLTKVGVIRQALRLYQAVDARLSKGETLIMEHDGKKAALVLL